MENRVIVVTGGAPASDYFDHLLRSGLGQQRDAAPRAVSRARGV